MSSHPCEETSGSRVLTEFEIQQRLYGKYLGRSRRPSEESKAASDPEWSGVEILKGELQSLRSQLIRLREEREILEKQLKEFNAPRPRRPGGRKRILALLVLLVLIGYPVGQRFLQASPSSVEASAYTLQVAVYHKPQPAESAQEYLRGLGYPAFQVEMPRRLGRKQYRVYVGRFVTRPEAELERERLASDPRFSEFKDAFVRYQ